MNDLSYKTIFNKGVVKHYLKALNLNEEEAKELIEKQIDAAILETIKTPQTYLEHPLINGITYLTHGLSFKDGFNNALSEKITEIRTEKKMELLKRAVLWATNAQKKEEERLTKGYARKPKIK